MYKKFVSLKILIQYWRATRIFWGRGDFVELKHFDKLFVKNTRKKVLQGKVLELFPLDTLKTTFSIEDLTQGWTQLEPFFQNQGTFFRFLKKSKVGLPSAPLVARLQ